MTPFILRLSRDALARRDAIEIAVRHLIPSRRAGAPARSAFAFKCDEREFARELLERRTNLWLYRTSQRAFAGDFVIVDVSSPVRSRRAVIVAELKRGERLRVGAPSSVQLRNAPHVRSELARAGVVGEIGDVIAATGDAREMLAFFGVSS